MPDWEAGCLEFTGGGAGQGGEKLYGPGYHDVRWPTSLKICPADGHCWTGLDDPPSPTDQEVWGRRLDRSGSY